MATCNCCGQTIRAKSTGTKADKKLAQDRERAQIAINSLRNWTPDPLDTELTNNAIREAIEVEIERLAQAINRPEQLWRIYRRADKGDRYA